MQRTRSWVGMWQQNLEYFLSEQTASDVRHKDWHQVVLNYIWPAIMQETAKLARNNPKIIVNPVEDNDADSAESWQGLLQWLWEHGLSDRGMRLDQIFGIVIGKIWGYRISKVFWEPKPDTGWDAKQKAWVGEVRHRLWHPAEFWSGETEFINEGNCGTRRPVDLQWAQARWPAQKEALGNQAVSYREAFGGDHVRGQSGSPGSTIDAVGTGKVDDGRLRRGSLASLVRKIERMTGMQSEVEQDRKFVMLSEAYRKNRTEVKKSEQQVIPVEELVNSGFQLNEVGQVLDPKTNEPLDPMPIRTVREWDEPTHPRGQYIIRVNDVILNPKPEDQVYPYKHWPFIISPHYLLPFMWQGSDAVQLYKSTQDMINVTASHMTNNMLQFGDPRIAVEEDALAQDVKRKGKRAFRIFRGPGAIIRLARGGLKRFRIEHPVPIGQGTLAMYQLFGQEFKNITGLQDVGAGRKTSGNQTKAEIQLLAISANDRVHLQSVFEDQWVKKVARQAGEIVQLHYPVGRVARIIGQDRVIGATEITQNLKALDLDVTIEPGQTLPFDEEKKIAKHAQAYEMLQQPIANPMLPEMLRVLEIPGWQKLLEKYEAWQLYFQFFQLFEAVKKGEVLPQDALKIIAQKATQLFLQDQANTVPAAPQENKRGQQNG